MDIGNLVLARYPAANFASPRDAFIAVTTDAQFTCPARRLARRSVQNRIRPTYRYFFTDSLSDNGALENTGAFHGIESLYLFGSFAAESNYSPNTQERDLSRQMLGFWTRLASGDVNAGGNVIWQDFLSSSDRYLELGETIQEKLDLRVPECEFWDMFPDLEKLYPDPT